MNAPNYHEKISLLVKRLQKYIDRPWYAPLIGILAALDNFLFLIPNDGILISSSMLIPKRWFWYAVVVTIGSTLGAVALATLVEFQGLPWILEIFPDIQATKTWSLTKEFFDRYGLLLVMVIAITPLMQQPAIILATVADTPIAQITLILFLGRFIKYLGMSYIGSHSPKLLNRLWGLKGELKDVGITNIEEK